MRRCSHNPCEICDNEIRKVADLIKDEYLLAREKANGDSRKMADLLGISRKTIYNYAKRYGIRVRDQKKTKDNTEWETPQTKPVSMSTS